MITTPQCCRLHTFSVPAYLSVPVYSLPCTAKIKLRLNYCEQWAEVTQYDRRALLIRVLNDWEVPLGKELAAVSCVLLPSVSVCVFVCGNRMDCGGIRAKHVTVNHFTQTPAIL